MTNHDIYAVDATWHFALPWMLLTFIVGLALGYLIGRRKARK